jgi:uncharacterized protein with PIN domain
MSIQVNQFVWKPGKNDAEYIRLLKRANDEAHSIMLRATSKLTRMAKTHAKVVHAKWEQSETGLWQSCSECGVAVEVQSMYMCKASEDENFNFCPHCGAKMDGDGNG